MNKEEAIGTLQDVAQRVFYRTGSRSVYIDKIVEIINQIDEPQKPVVPKFVANWYEENKDNFEYNVQCLCVHNCEPLREIDTWFDSDDTKPVETLVMMHKFGYEIEKEKLYTEDFTKPNKCLTMALESIQGLYNEKRIEDRENAERLIDSYKYAIELLTKEEVE